MGPSKSRVPAFSTFPPSRHPSGTRARSIFAVAATSAGNNSATPLSARCHKFVLPRTPRDINNSVCKGVRSRARAPASQRDYERSRSSCWRSLFDERDEIGSALLKVSSRRSVRRRNQLKHVRVRQELGEMNG